MDTPDQTKRIFLLGSMVMIVLLVGGLIWAIASTPPGPPAGVFDDTDNPSTGVASSTVTLRIFGDFQCPACRVAEVGVSYVRRVYGDRIRIIWDDFPLLATHKNALIAAHAARCAQDQGFFWQYHDRLYEDQPAWSVMDSPMQKFEEYASALGLQTETFSSCLASRPNEQKIRTDLREGESMGVRATPTFFLNGKKIEGVLENDAWDREITAVLK